MKSSAKKLVLKRNNNRGHWVGDGFPVRSAFSYSERELDLSPFLLLDYAGPVEFKPTQERLGVGSHPHRGFETVTIVYQGEVEHRDSAGGGGVIGKGDVQWMTAGAGIIHEEFHGKNFAKDGGPFEMVQLWVNLPKKDKSAKPKYQSLLNSQIPEATLLNGSVRVIAGEFLNGSESFKGPAQTFTPVNLWDVRLKNSGVLNLKVRDGSTASIFVLSGRIKVAGETAGENDLLVFDRNGSEIVVEGLEDAKILFMSGKPLDEPVVGYGPFVMNTEGEIKEAYEDFHSGRFGDLPPQ